MWPGYCLQHLFKGHRWPWTSLPLLGLLGDVDCDDVLLTAWAICQYMTARFQLPFLSHNCGSRHVGVGCRKAAIMGRMDISNGVHEKVRARRLLRQQHQWNPGAATTVKPVSSTKLCQTAGESCQRRRLNLNRPSLSLTLTLASLWLTVSALQTLSIPSCLEVDGECKGKNESILAAVNKNKHSFCCVNFLSSVCVPRSVLCTCKKEFFSLPSFTGPL